MATEDLIDSRISMKQCKLAVEALHAHETKKAKEQDESELLPKEQFVWLNISVKKQAPGQKFKPVKIPVVHPLIDPRTTSICLFTKDPQREYKDLLEKHSIKFISRVIGLEKLKGKYGSYEARRMLLKENGMFLADERILPLLPKLLGTKFFAAKKQPIPVCLTRKDLKGELEHAVSSTYMSQNSGTCTSVKIGTLSQKPSQILANIQKALPAIATGLYGGWDNVQSLSLKTSSSMALPIWSCTLDGQEGGRWAGLTAKDEDLEMADAVDEAVELPKESTKKGKKRASIQEDEPVAVEKSKKKSKKVEEEIQETAAPDPQKKKKRKAAEEGDAVVIASAADTKSKKRRKSKDARD